MSDCGASAVRRPRDHLDEDVYPYVGGFRQSPERPYALYGVWNDWAGEDREVCISRDSKSFRGTPSEVSAVLRRDLQMNGVALDNQVGGRFNPFTQEPIPNPVNTLEDGLGVPGASVMDAASNSAKAVSDAASSVIEAAKNVASNIADAAFPDAEPDTGNETVGSADSASDDSGPSIGRRTVKVIRENPGRATGAGVLLVLVVVGIVFLVKRGG